ncbi:MAG TPA: SDR family NAD(P)-dependent oxidoreductase [Solirubrobacterales bacterium]|nr:SDR family NAD(P)-dependent oxidoreductase [Solirubrobacterales bacterium]
METEELRFDGRVALVTGAGRGLGRAYALALAERGAKVVVNDLGAGLTGSGADPGRAQGVADEIVAAGGEAVANGDSVTETAGAEAMVALALERFGRLDVVINNAGNMDPAGLPELRVAELSRHLDIHVLGTFNVTRAAWPELTARGYGRIIVTTSIGFFGAPFMISYSTAKGGAFSLGRSLALAGADQGIRVNLLAPVAETRMVTDPELREKCNLPPLAPGAEPDPERGVDAVTPMALLLAHESCPGNGETLIAGLGRFARIFAAETRGILAPGLGPEDLLDLWPEIVDESGYVVQTATADSVAFREEMVARARGGNA